MSEAWFSHTRSSFRRLRDNWREADEDTQYRFVFMVIGVILIAAAIVGQFGWMGALFCAGMFFWAAGTSKD